MKISKLAISLVAIGGAFVATAASAQPAPAPAPEQPYCREYTQTFTVAGKSEKGYGTACLQPDGSWQIMSQDNESAPSNADATYTVRDNNVYVVPTRTVFAPGYEWDGYPVSYLSVGVGGGRGYYGGHYRHPYWR